MASAGRPVTNTLAVTHRAALVLVARLTGTCIGGEVFPLSRAGAARQ